MPALSPITAQVPVAFQCFRTPEHYVLEANIPEEIEYIKSLEFQRLVPLYDRPVKMLTTDERKAIWADIFRAHDNPTVEDIFIAIEKALLQ
jgi:hypothetical protein